MRRILEWRCDARAFITPLVRATVPPWRLAAYADGADDPPLDDAALDQMAEGRANLDYAFSIAWSPRWVTRGEPHRWVEGTQHFVGCVACRRITVHESIREGYGWWEEHALAEHA